MGRRSCVLAIAVLTIIGSQSAYSQVSDSVLNALVGDNVEVELVEGNVRVAGVLKSVVEDSIVVASKDGDVIQISKSDIKEIRVEPETDSTMAADSTGTDLRRQKEFQYEQQRKDPWGPFVLNFLLGLGIGSFVQGDITGGLIVAGGELLGLGLIITWASAAAEDVVYDDGGYRLESTTSSNGTLILGASILAAARVAALVVPFTYANSFNEKLRGELGLTVTDVALIVPGVNGDERSGYGLMVTMAM